jgi:hypothetical protein
MPKFLNEHQVGFGTNLIGFPNLGGCLAVVLQNKGGLFGFHITPGNARQSGEYARFIQSSVNFQAGQSTHLYGSCYRANRYQGDIGKWQEEMREIAKAIGYTGLISGYDTSAKGNKIKMDETTYLEYRLSGDNSCAVYFKRMSKMDTVDEYGVTDPDVKVIKRDPVKTTDVWNPEFRTLDPKAAASPITTSAAVKPTRSNKGEMHFVKADALDTFQYP